ncbi:MAG: PAS domain S-box protein [Desulfovibrionales bacterium]|nr:PAS domain S-box protein [Desulfovibrionales bacterium]
MCSTAEKPTYEELKQRVKKLEKEVSELTGAEADIRLVRDKFKDILPAMGDGVDITTYDYKVVYANDNLKKIIGKDELEGHLCYKVFLERDAPCANCPMRRAIENWKTEIEEILQPNGRLIELSASPFRLASGEMAAIEIAKDITDRRRAEEALRDSEERYRRLFEEARDGIILADAKTGVIVDCNHAAARLVGREKSELIGQHQTILHPPDRVKGKFSETFDKHLEEGEGQVLETQVITSTGEIKEVAIKANLLRLGDRICLQGIFRDITEQKRAEEALQESERRYRTIFEDSRDPIYISGRDGQFIDVNRATLDLFGYIREEMIGMDVLKIYVNPDDRRRFQQEIEQKGSVRDYEMKFIKKDGTELDCLLTSTVRRAADGSILGYKGIIRDETERKRLESQLRQAQKMEAIGTLAGGIAHDFNNILAGIIGYTELAELIIAEGSPAKAKLDEVLKAAERATGLVRQILTFSRQGEQEPKVLQIGAATKEALKWLRSTLPATIEIRQDIRTDSGRVLLDPTRLNQVLINLCTNSAHAMRERGGVLEVSVVEVVLDAAGVAQCPDMKPGPYVRLTVSDTGCGMTPSVMARIFDPYFTTKEKGEGTGLGLAVIHGIIQSCGGKIVVYSEPGKGTTFHIYLPRVDMPPSEETAQFGDLPRGNERILFVDDEETLIDIGREMLRYLGYTAVVTTSSIEALETFRSQPDRFDLIITDQTMPRMTGDMLAKELLKIRPDIPIILCSGYSERITKETGGIQALIMKPFVMRNLAEIIREVLDKNR